MLSPCEILAIRLAMPAAVNVNPVTVNATKILNIISRERLNKTRSNIIGKATKRTPIERKCK